MVHETIHFDDVSKGGTTGLPNPFVKPNSKGNRPSTTRSGTL